MFVDHAFLLDGSWFYLFRAPFGVGCGQGYVSPVRDVCVLGLQHLLVNHKNILVQR